MKSAKNAKVRPAASAKEEECGIWLDTKELKEKKQQKQQTRPISTLLNPLARSGGYSVAVALSFTQTKLNMPVTRQSTISTFFSPKSRDLPPSAGASSSMHTEAHTGAKRKHDFILEPSTEPASQTSDVYCDEGFERLSAKDKKEQSFLHLICGTNPEEEEPPQKKRHVVHYAENVSETQECCKKETSNEYTNQTVPETETFFCKDMVVWKPFEDAHRHFLKSPDPKHANKHGLRDQKASVKGSILTSRPVNENHKRLSASVNIDKSQEQSWHKNKASPMKRIGKENRWSPSPIKSPTWHFKHCLITSPAKCRLKEKCTFSPKKLRVEPADTEMVGEPLSTLFTQDSEGFCVIAHREQHLKSPLIDRSNLFVGTGDGNNPSAASLEKEEEESDLEPEMLFTQDSEGNTVIKH
ncbi:aurora kinase A and ninein-interacting protein [Puntigrus tetrazona]|uniref:aurora kinase A and ninein-interacting protein n=1 Tax=Puntigrus tetrazona TaxID=1606681 RepID=UPI001C8A970C|nr:aurora kinase A and ninein-interacting protein [Puntigrus tetrazona]